MTSADLKELLTRIHIDKYRIVELVINVRRDNVEDVFRQKVTITLEKGDNRVILESAEEDFCIYAIQLQGIVDSEGDYQMVPVKNVQQYWNDLEYLIDEHHGHLNTARRDNEQGKFPCRYEDLQSSAYLIQEFLKRRRNVKDQRFATLKRDYHHILAAALMLSQITLLAQKQLEASRPNVKPLILQLDRLFLPFRQQGNPIKNFKHYRAYVTFDVVDWQDNLATQLKPLGDIMQDGIKKKSVPWDSATPMLGSIYHRCIELSKESINLLRAGLEMNKGNISPAKKLGLGQNIAILKADADYGPIFHCLDPQIRHGYAHCSMDFKEGLVRILDLQGRKTKVVRTYKPDEFVRMVDVLLHELLPALISIVILHDLAILDMLLYSKEYRLCLAAIGNC